MAKSNFHISRFGDRVQWCIDNLDTDASLARFIIDFNGVYDRLFDAIKEGVYRADPMGARSKKTWQTARNKGEVPDVYVDWLCTLYPDLKREHLLQSSYDEFLRLGEAIVRARRRWDEAIELVARERNRVNEVAKQFYRSVDISGADYPLLIAEKSWLRGAPLELTHALEQKEASLPKPGAAFGQVRLAGLSADYVSYKGTKAYRTRKEIKKEPQHNGEIFCVDRVLTDAGGFTGFEYYLGHYYDYINTCEVLGAELADWMIRNRRSDFPERFEHRGAPSDAFSFRARATYPGVNCVSIFLNYREPAARNRPELPSGDYFLLHKRDETQLQAQNLVHVLPAGGHQAFAAGAQKQDTPIRKTVIREFLEELFDQEKLYKQIDSWGDYLGFPEIKELHRVFFEEPGPAATIYLFGFGVDPVTLKPEVLCGIVVDWERAKQKKPDLLLKFNWEVQSRLPNEPRRTWVPLSREELFRQARGGVQSLDGNFLGTLAAGSACMQYAATHLKEILPDSR